MKASYHTKTTTPAAVWFTRGAAHGTPRLSRDGVCGTTRQNTSRARVRSLRVSSEISLPFMLTCARLQFDINMTSRSRIALSFHILSSSGQRSTSAPPYSSARHQHQRHRDPLPSPPGISKSPARRSSSSGGPNATTAAAASTVPAGLMLRPVFRRPMYVT